LFRETAKEVIASAHYFEFDQANAAHEIKKLRLFNQRLLRRMSPSRATGALYDPLVGHRGRGALCFGGRGTRCFLRKITGREVRGQIVFNTTDTDESNTNIGSNLPQVRQQSFPAPIGRLLGLILIQAENGRAVVELDADERHANPMGTLHGGVLCDLADAAMGIAYRTTLAQHESFTTLELKINFLRPVWKTQLRAKARVVRAGKIVGLVECDVVDEQGRLVARASSTCMTLQGRLAEGRRPPALSTLITPGVQQQRTLDHHT
jgi:uncharacterized protein (TIGR00369 family)